MGLYTLFCLTIDRKRKKEREQRRSSHCSHPWMPPPIFFFFTFSRKGWVQQWSGYQHKGEPLNEITCLAGKERTTCPRQQAPRSNNILTDNKTTRFGIFFLSQARHSHRTKSAQNMTRKWAFVDGCHLQAHTTRRRGGGGMILLAELSFHF